MQICRRESAILMKMEEDAAQLSEVFKNRDLPADLSSA